MKIGVFIICWLVCGFVARCMAKYEFVERFNNWNREDEILCGILVIGGPLNLLGYIFDQLISDFDYGERRYYWGLKL